MFQHWPDDQIMIIRQLVIQHLRDHQRALNIVRLEFGVWHYHTITNVIAWLEHIFWICLQNWVTQLPDVLLDFIKVTISNPPVFELIYHVKFPQISYNFISATKPKTLKNISTWIPCRLHGIQVGHILPDILQNLPGIHMDSIKGYFILFDLILSRHHIT